MRMLILLAIAIAISGCGPSVEFLTREKPVVVMPDREMFDCPDTVVIPDISTLTDLQVAKVVVELKSNLEVCRNKLKSLETFLIQSKKRLEK
jgi:hypothetical protein